MDYNELIAETKKALENYSKAEAELEELYRQAKERSNKSYELSKRQLAEQYYEDKNQAAARAKLDAKDMNEFLAARGLASSGESVQARLDSNTALNNTLAALAKENMKAAAELEKERLNQETQMDLSLAEKKLELSKQKSALSEQIEQLKKALESGSKSAVGSGGSDKTGKSEKPDSGEKEKPFVPSTSAKDIARKIVETYAAEGRITSDLEKSKIKKYLQSLVQNDGVDEDYIKEVVFNLKTYGYTDISDAYADAVLLSEEASKYYDKLYYELYEIYVRGNRTAEKAISMAEKKAKTLMLDYLYERSKTIAAFESSAKAAGVSQAELEAYYESVNNINSNSRKTILGSKVS